MATPPRPAQAPNIPAEEGPLYDARPTLPLRPIEGPIEAPPPVVRHAPDDPDDDAAEDTEPRRNAAYFGAAQPGA